MLERGADPDALDSSHDTPMHYALLGHKSVAAAALLRAGAVFDVLGDRGHTPLQLACRVGDDFSALLLLLRFGLIGAARFNFVYVPHLIFIWGTQKGSVNGAGG